MSAGPRKAVRWQKSEDRGEILRIGPSQVEANCQDLLPRRDVVTDQQIRLFRDRDVIEPGELFFRSGST
jgi:hypothetical protein